MIAIVDDDTAVRQSMICFLSAAGFETQEYSDGDHFLSDSKALGLHSCVILDLRMPGTQGLAVLAALKAREAMPPVIVVTGHGDIGSAVEAMKLGACDFIEKPYKPEDLLNSIRLAHLAQLKMSDLQELKAEAQKALGKLSRREMEVFQGIVSGKQNKLIAYELSISIRTVETYRARLFERIGVRGTAEAVRIAIAAGVI